MKNLVLFVLLVFLSSCRRSEPCHFNLAANSDTSLFISFTFDNIKYHYFQHRYDQGGAASSSGVILGNQEVLNVFYRVQFDDPDWNGARFTNNSIKYHPYVELGFTDSIMVKNDILAKYTIPLFSTSLSKNFKFTTPKTGRSPVTLSDFDPLFFPGVSIDLHLDDIEYSTMLLGDHYRYSADSLNKYLWTNSSFEVTSIENVCNDMKLVTGKFTTTVMPSYITTLVKVDNGYFKILIQ
jgi:hypothetical protein